MSTGGVRIYERVSHAPALAIVLTDEFAVARSGKNDASTPLGDMTLYVTEQLAPVAKSFDIPMECVTRANRTGYLLLSGEVRGKAGIGTRKLAGGEYRFLLTSDYYQSIEFSGAWPPNVQGNINQSLNLLPGPTYPFPDMSVKQRKRGVTLLRGTLLQGDRVPRAKVKVAWANPLLPKEIKGFTTCITDQKGDWVFAFIDLDPEESSQRPLDCVVRVNDPDGTYEAETRLRLGEDNSASPTVLLGQVVDTKGMAIPSASVTVSSLKGESITNREGQWVFYCGIRPSREPVTVTATAPNGLSIGVPASIKGGKTTKVGKIILSL